MKKYLMTGIAAIAMCAAFTSCSKDVDFGQTVQEDRVQAKYDQAFLNYIGGPIDPNQDWGFSANVTRSVNVNGNEWETRPEVTAEEAAAVYAWVNRPKSEIPTESYYEVSPVNMKNFFVTQVWGKDNNTNDANAKYKNYDNGNVFGGEKMNHLQISKSADRLGIDGVASANNGEGAINANWDHANNFNASQNRDWDGNTMFVDWGTQNFAYHNSEDSKYHDKWIIVDGAYITDSKGINHAGKYYVCFDYIGRNPNAYTNFQEPNVGNVTVPGAWKTVEDAVNAGATASNGHKVASNWSKGNIVGGNMIVDANEYYTDWIIRLVEAQPKYDLKIIAEDLSAQGNSDFDFNDVVLEVRYATSTSPTKVRLTHAGGTLPLVISIDGTINEAFEVHTLFNVQPNDMVNTGAGPERTPVVLTDRQDFNVSITNAAEANEKLKLFVYKENAWHEMKAPKGEPACKLAVGMDYVVLRERVSIKGAFEKFVDWATDASFTSKWW